MGKKLSRSFSRNNSGGRQRSWLIYQLDWLEYITHTAEVSCAYSSDCRDEYAGLELLPLLAFSSGTAHGKMRSIDLWPFLLLSTDCRHVKLTVFIKLFYLISYPYTSLPFGIQAIVNIDGQYSSLIKVSAR